MGDACVANCASQPNPKKIYRAPSCPLAGVGSLLLLLGHVPGVGLQRGLGGDAEVVVDVGEDVQLVHFPLGGLRLRLLRSLPGGGLLRRRARGTRARVRNRATMWKKTGNRIKKKGDGPKIARGSKRPSKNKRQVGDTPRYFSQPSFCARTGAKTSLVWYP